MKKIITEIKLNSLSEFSIVHVSDTHLTYADSRDNERKHELAKARCEIFPQAEECLKETERYAKAIDSVIVHTGDLIDFVSYANLDAAGEFAANNKLLMTAGNHEFSQYVGEAFEDKAYREQSLDKVQAVFNNDIRFASAIIDGVKLICIDNGYYRFEAEQLDALKKEVSEGLPILLFMHNPLYEKSLYDRMMQDSKSACLCTVPEELMQSYPENRYIQQLADDITSDATEYIKSEPLIKAIFTGHLHFDYECELRPGLMQYTTGKTTIREIKVIKE